MVARILLVLIVVPLVELTLLMVLADWTNWQTALALVLVTGVAGGLLIRHQGWRTLSRIQSELAAGQMPADALLDGVLILAAGVLLLTPGILTDLIGLFLLIPASRQLVKAYLGRRFRARFRSTTIVEGTFVRRADDDRWIEQRPR